MGGVSEWRKRESTGEGGRGTAGPLRGNRKSGVGRRQLEHWVAEGTGSLGW